MAVEVHYEILTQNYDKAITIVILALKELKGKSLRTPAFTATVMILTAKSTTSTTCNVAKKVIGLVRRDIKAIGI